MLYNVNNCTKHKGTNKVRKIMFNSSNNLDIILKVDKLRKEFKKGVVAVVI